MLLLEGIFTDRMKLVDVIALYKFVIPMCLIIERYFHCYV